ncbi:MAG TPA: hypothetical protein VG276_31905, partial [Actinomycetes bacterium]|nr:hypothetical protein [Actinomycetes bacterium]
MGVIFGINGLAKVLDKGSYDFKVVSFGLIDRGTARGLLAGCAGPKSPCDRAAEVVLHPPRPGPLGTLVCLPDRGRGDGRRPAVLRHREPPWRLGLILPLQIMVINNGGYLFDFAPDWVPLAILLVVPSGRAWGLTAAWPPGSATADQGGSSYGDDGTRSQARPERRGWGCPGGTAGRARTRQGDPSSRTASSSMAAPRLT